MRNEGLFSVTELIVQRIPGVKIFPTSILRIFFNHKHCFVFWAFSMSHWSLTQTVISIKYVKRSSIAQGVFSHGISLNSPFLMCNAWATIIVSFLFYFIFIFFLKNNFCQISKWIHHRHTCVPHPEPSSLLPPHTIPLGHPSAPAPSIQHRASNLDWQLVSYMIFYMFHCHSSKSSHPLPLPQSP